MIESFVFLGLSLNAWITIVLVLVMFGLLLFTKLPADVVFVGGMAVLLVCGVLPAKEVLSGFSSESVVVVGVLFVVVAGLVYTGVLQWIVRHLLGNPSSYPKAIVRLMLPVAMLSSMLSNTTVVALFINVVKMWSKKLDVAPSKLLISLSYASDKVKNATAGHFAGLDSSGNLTDSGKKPGDFANASHAHAGYAEVKIFSGVSVAASAWVSDSTYAAYPYAASIACPGVTASHVPEVVFGATEAASGNFAPVALSGSGTVKIYAATKPTAAITVQSITCIKAVS